MTEVDEYEVEEQNMLRSPDYFRSRLVVRIQDTNKACLGDVMEPWQDSDFRAMDPCLKYMAGRSSEKPPVRRFWRQRARGHSKTTDAAVNVTWLLWSAKSAIWGMAAADDKEQASLLSQQMDFLRDDNEWLMDRLEYQKNKIINKVSGAYLEIVSSDVNSSWGSTPDFVIADEFTHWSDSKFWNSIFSSFAKRTGMLIVCCNAGAGRDWKWNVREAARTSDMWHFSAPVGTIASWLAESTLEEQRSMLPPVEYSRLWENLWQETGGEFVSLAEAEACCNPNLIRLECGIPGWQYIATLDFAEKRDYTVGTVGHVYNHQIIIDTMDVIVPTPNSPTKVSWVKQWMHNVVEDFGDVRFIIDKFQLLGTIEELMELGYDIEEFDFASGNGNYEMGVALRQCILHQKIQWYPGCGAVDQPWGRDDLETELASLVVKSYNDGRRWRFDHLRDNTHHDDRAFTAGVLCLHCIRGQRDGYGYFSLQDPTPDGSFHISAA